MPGMIPAYPELQSCLQSGAHRGIRKPAFVFFQLKELFAQVPTSILTQKVIRFIK
jgi:hypothetical protein